MTPDSPAARAGLRQGDVVLSYDGKPIDTLRDLTRRVAETRAGGTVDLKILHEGREKTVAVHIDRLADTTQVAANDPAKAERPADESVKGLKLATLDPAARKRLGLGEKVTGVVVTGLTAKTETPIRAGDVILRVGDETVKTPADVQRKVAEAEKAGQKAVLVLISRQGNETFVALKLGQA